MHITLQLKKALPAVIGVFIVMCATLAGIQKIISEKGLVTGQPGMNTFTDKSPGETQPLDRPYDGAPPFIPHAIADFTIAKDGNDCLECHIEGEEVDEGHIATKIPTSHFTNTYTGVQKEGEVIGIRFNCLQCHVPQVSEEPSYVEMKK